MRAPRFGPLGGDPERGRGSSPEGLFHLARRVSPAASAITLLATPSLGSRRVHSKDLMGGTGENSRDVCDDAQPSCAEVRTRNGGGYAGWGGLRVTGPRGGCSSPPLGSSSSVTFATVASPVRREGEK